MKKIELDLFLEKDGDVFIQSIFLFKVESLRTAIHHSLIKKQEKVLIEEEIPKEMKSLDSGNLLYKKHQLPLTDEGLKRMKDIDLFQLEF